MAIRVIIEREVRQGRQNEMMSTLRELRALALPKSGHISGETLRSKDDPPTYIVSAPGRAWRTG